MIDQIIEQLKTGRITNVIEYGAANLPEPPYIVVRQSTDSLERGILYRIFVHMKPGQQPYLREYARNDVGVLLNDFEAVNDNGNRNKLFTVEEFTDIIISNDDKTISKERRYLMPSRVF